MAVRAKRREFNSPQCAFPAMTMPICRASDSDASSSRIGVTAAARATFCHCPQRHLRRNGQADIASKTDRCPDRRQQDRMYWRRQVRAWQICQPGLSPAADGSGAAGPDTVTARSSPGTSKIASVTKRAGPAADLDRRQPAADPVHVRDCQPRTQENPIGLDLVLQGQRGNRRRHQHRSSARDQRQHQVIGSRPCCGRNFLCGGLRDGVRNGMGRFAHRDALGTQSVGRPPE